MPSIKTTALRLLLVLSMLCGAGQAMGGPVYQVTLDTGALAGQGGYIDFLMLALADATPVEASIRNFSGDFGAASYRSGDVAGTLGGGVVIGNANGFGNFGQWASFGGIFKFDLSFRAGTEAGPGSNLGIALLDADWNYLGTMGDVVTFMLQPGGEDAVHADAALAAVSVAEPSSLILLAPSLLLLWLCLARPHRPQLRRGV